MPAAQGVVLYICLCVRKHIVVFFIRTSPCTADTVILERRHDKQSQSCFWRNSTLWGLIYASELKLSSTQALELAYFWCRHAGSFASVSAGSKICLRHADSAWSSPARMNCETSAKDELRNRIVSGDVLYLIVLCLSDLTTMQWHCRITALSQCRPVITNQGTQQTALS